MHGTPIVASGIDTSREVLAGAGRNVRFVTNWQPQAWAEALDGVLADPDARTAAKEFMPIIRDRYGEDRMLRRYRALYDELLA